MITWEKNSRRGLFALIFAAVVVVPFAACSGPADLRTLDDPLVKVVVHKDAGHKDAGHKVDAGNPSADDACFDYATIICAKLDQCTQFTWVEQHYANTEQCIEREEISCLASLEAPDNGATPLGTEHCGAAIQSGTCNDFFDHTNVASACSARPGPRADGAACAFNGQCASTWCYVAGTSVCGVCAERPDFRRRVHAKLRLRREGIALLRRRLLRAGHHRGRRMQRGGSCARSRRSVSVPDAGADAARIGFCVQEGEEAGVPCDSTLTTTALCDEGSGYFCPSATDRCAATLLAGFGEKCGVTAGKVIGPDARAPSSLTRCAAAGTCLPTSPTSKAESCVAPLFEGDACDTMTGPPCLSPARCVTTSDASTAGTCAILGVTNACN